MTRLLTLCCLLLAGLGLGSVSARAEYLWDEGSAFSSNRSAGTSSRSSDRPAARASSRGVSRSQRAARAGRDLESRPQRRTASRSGSMPSLTGGSHQSGIASYYWQPQRVASGGWFNPNAMTAAHKTLPFGTKVRVTSSSGRSVVVTINDRGPYVRGRVIDLSRAAASALGMTGAGLARVQLAVLGR